MSSCKSVQTISSKVGFKWGGTDLCAAFAVEKCQVFRQACSLSKIMVLFLWTVKMPRMLSCQQKQANTSCFNDWAKKY